VILVDTSVWIDHLRAGDDELARWLDDGEVLTHAFVIGELACGNIRNRAEVLRLLEHLPAARLATHAEAMHLVTQRRLMGRGIGYFDAHLLASAAITPETRLSTHDRRLAGIAAELKVAVGY
jgi:predicted nucleic acid-binding protein